MIKINGLKVDSFVFPGGELQVRLPKELKVSQKYKVIAWLQSSNDIIELLLSIDALESMFSTNINIELHIPYLPYARQDRVANSGEALSVRVISKLLSSLGSTELFLYDVHSSAADLFLWGSWTEYPLQSICKSYIESLPEDDDILLISPDLGAEDKLKEVSRYSGIDLARGFKIRETSTGKVYGFDIYTRDKEKIKGKKCYILDDICDGGGTFIGLAKELYKLGAKEVHLFVTHGIFSNGVDILLDNGITSVATTNTWIRDKEEPRLKVFMEVK